MGLKQVFQETDVGLIPEEWEIKRLGSMFTFLRTTALSRAQLSIDGGVRYVHYGDIHTKWSNRLDLSSEVLPQSQPDQVQSAARVRDGDLILADASEDLAGVGKSVEVSNAGDIPTVAGLHTVLLRPTTGIFAPGFCGYLQEMPSFISQSRRLAAGLKVFGLSKTSLACIEVPVPPLDEQCAIAEALGDVDHLLKSLGALIAKKRDIGIGIKQQLLHARTRLTGFDSEWSIRKLGDLLRYEQPTPYLVGSADYTTGGDVAVLTAGKTLLLGYTSESHGIYQSLPVIIFDDFTTASKYVDLPFKVKSSACKMLTARSDECDLRYMFERLQMIGHEYANHKRHWISVFQSLEVLVPSLSEQRAIAKVFAEADAEVDALVARQDKMRMIRQGMVQDLLSGRVQLV